MVRSKTTAYAEAQVKQSQHSQHGILQCKCACGQHTVAGGECAHSAGRSHSMNDRSASPQLG
jgi:hypothetical protein